MRRRLTCLLAFALWVPACASADDPVRSLTLLHTNDLHARLLPDDEGRGGFAYLAAVIRRECGASEGCLVLDGGDLVQGTPVSSVFRGVPVFEIASGLGLDASTLGNHEFDYGWEVIQEYIDEADFPIVTANVTNDAGALLGRTPYVILEANGVRVGVIGVLTEDLRFLTTADRIGPWRVGSAVDAVRRYLPEVREKSDVVVVLGHLEDDEEEAILAGFPDVAAVVAGHGHGGLGEPVVIDQRPLVRVKAYGRELGRLDLTVDTGNRSVLAWSWKAIPIRVSEIEPAADVARNVHEWEAKVAQVVDVRIGESRRRLAHGEVRTLLERALRETMGADLAYVNQGGVRDTLPEGPLTARDVWNVMPFENVVVVGEFKGSELPRFLIEERGIDPGRTYRLATMDFVAANWKERRQADLAFTVTDRLVRDVVIDWIRARGVLDFDADEP